MRGVEKVSTCTSLQHYWALLGIYCTSFVMYYQQQSLFLTFFIFQIQLINISAMI